MDQVAAFGIDVPDPASRSGVVDARKGRQAVVQSTAELAPAFAEEQAWPYATCVVRTREPDVALRSRSGLLWRLLC
jgi:hypothetical protein